MVQLSDDSSEAIVKRLKRAHGQLGAVIRMLEEGRDCEEIVTQLSAANKAVSRAGYTIITSGLSQCYQENPQNAEVDTKKLEKLFLSLA